MKTISILNIKGGVAKTTSALAIAQLLMQEYGKRVLLIDADPQGNATRTLEPNAELTCSSADMLDQGSTVSSETLIVKTAAGIDLIGADFRLLSADRRCLLDVASPQQTRFRRRLRSPDMSDRYDFCIIDCPPNLSMSAINALAASDFVYVPVRADKYGLDGLEYVAETIEQIRELNPALRLGGCFLTMVRSRTSLLHTARRELEQLGFPVMNACIRACTKAGEATFAGKTLLSYAPGCTAAQDYRELCAEMIENIESEENNNG